MRHELKCWPEYFQPIIDGLKRFEVRKDDRSFQQGDELLLREYDMRDDHYTGREAVVDVIYLLRGESWALQPGIVVMSIDLKTVTDEL
jgi:hypothetical protein